MQLALTAAAIALAASALAGCTPPENDPRLPLDTPTFVQLHIPNPAAPGTWMGYSSGTDTYRLMPLPGRSVRIWFYASAGGVFSVALRDLTGNPTSLAETTGCGSAPTAPAAGCFEVLTKSPPADPARQTLYSMHVTAPSGHPINYDIRVIDVSQVSDRSNSEAMVVKLRQKRNFTVNVTVTGSGFVSSTPPGIRCGLFTSGTTYTECSFAFGPGQVRLDPSAATFVDPNNKFRHWEGQCAPKVQSCVLTLDPVGLGPTVAIARFLDGAGGPVMEPTCKPARVLEGWTFVGSPLSPASVTGGVVVCDSEGYVVCAPGPMNVTGPRCGPEKTDNTPVCADMNARLHPGGCYTRNDFP